MQGEQLSKKDRRAMKRRGKLSDRNKQVRKSMIQNVFFALLGLLIIGGATWFFVSRDEAQPAPGEDKVIAKTGLHWHPHLVITIKGKEQEMPASIGLGLTEKPIHTHDATGIIHLEFLGLVKESDTKLGEFFKVWGKQFNSECILEYCNGPDGRVKMIVNGQENADFENYLMKDSDKIEIRYE